MKMNNSDFLGKDKILPLLLKLSIPATIGMIISALYNVVDTIFVGQGVGPRAIAALSIAFPIQLLIGAVSQAIGIGSASIISRKLGEQKKQEACATAGTAISAITFFALLLTISLLVFLKPILVFFGASETILPYAEEYMRYIAFGFFFLSFSMASSALVRSEGNARAAMNGMLIGAALNIILDPVFIFLLGMGIKGAALATVISQFFSFVYFLSFYLRKRSLLTITLHDLVIRFYLLKDSFILGLPNFIQMSGLSLLVLIINNNLGLYGGDMAISSYGIINRLFSFIILPLFGLIQGFQPISGYNYGAKNYKRVKSVLKSTALISVLIASLGFFVMMFFSNHLISLFTEDDFLITSTAGYLRTFILFVPIIGIQLVGSTYFQAIGKKTASLILSLSRQFIILIPLVIFLPQVIGLKGIWIAFPISDFSATLITTVFLLFELRRLNRKEKLPLESEIYTPEGLPVQE